MTISVLDLITKIRKDTPCLSNYGGFGYCAYGSKLLSNAMVQHGLPHQLLTTQRIAKTHEGELIKKAITDIINSFPYDLPRYNIYSIIYRHFNDNPARAFDTMGHAVVLNEDTIYDITHDQYCFPVSYSLDFLKRCWESIYISDIAIKLSDDFHTGKITRLNKLAPSRSMASAIHWK